MYTDIVIAGGGASGLTAAVMAARAGKKVVVLEHKDRIGKKILATGNGKCNYTNTVQDESCYHSSNEGFPQKVLDCFGYSETMDFFMGMGIYPKIKNGYVYPHSEQASAIMDVFKAELAHLEITVFLSEHIRDLKKDNGQFTVFTEKALYQCSSVILCTGGRASAILGSDGSGYALAVKMGHRLVTPVPALIGLKARESGFKTMNGVRATAAVTLYLEDRQIMTETGEIQLASYGMSGIPVFQISRFAARALNEGKKTEVSLDFFPDADEESLCRLIISRSRNTYKTASEMMTGLLNKKIVQVILKKVGIPMDYKAEKLNEAELGAIASQIKNFRTEITDTNGFEHAQVTAGGIDTLEIEPETMESKIVKGLYFAGEIVDADGMCGGYNLQWAWSTGALAGIHAAKQNQNSG